MTYPTSRESHPNPADDTRAPDRFDWKDAQLVRRCPYLTGDEKALLLDLRDYQNPKRGNAAWPSQETLAEHHGCWRKAIRRRVRSLEAKGLLVVDRRDGENDHYWPIIPTWLRAGEEPEWLARQDRWPALLDPEPDARLSPAGPPGSPAPVSSDASSPTTRVASSPTTRVASDPTTRVASDPRVGEEAVGEGNGGTSSLARAIPSGLPASGAHGASRPDDGPDDPPEAGESSPDPQEKENGPDGNGAAAPPVEEAVAGREGDAGPDATLEGQEAEKPAGETGAPAQGEPRTLDSRPIERCWENGRTAAVIVGGECVELPAGFDARELDHEGEMRRRLGLPWVLGESADGSELIFQTGPHGPWLLAQRPGESRHHASAGLRDKPLDPLALTAEDAERLLRGGEPDPDARCWLEPPAPDEFDVEDEDMDTMPWEKEIEAYFKASGVRPPRQEERRRLAQAVEAVGPPAGEETDADPDALRVCRVLAALYAKKHRRDQWYEGAIAALPVERDSLLTIAACVEAWGRACREIGRTREGNELISISEARKLDIQKTLAAMVEIQRPWAFVRYVVRDAGGYSPVFAFSERTIRRAKKERRGLFGYKMQRQDYGRLPEGIKVVEGGKKRRPGRKRMPGERPWSERQHGGTVVEDEEAPARRAAGLPPGVRVVD